MNRRWRRNSHACLIARGAPAWAVREATVGTVKLLIPPGLRIAEFWTRRVRRLDRQALPHLVGNACLLAFELLVRRLVFLSQRCSVYFHEPAAATDQRKQQVPPQRFTTPLRERRA